MCDCVLHSLYSHETSTRSHDLLSICKVPHVVSCYFMHIYCYSLCYYHILQYLFPKESVSVLWITDFWKIGAIYFKWVLKFVINFNYNVFEKFYFTTKDLKNTNWFCRKSLLECVLFKPIVDILKKIFPLRSL